MVLVTGQFVRFPHREYMVKLYDGKIQMNLEEVPVIGNPNAPHSIVSLFDYACSHCRIMHEHLKEAHRQLGTNLAIVSLPMPLCEKCNRTVKQSPKEHADACDYARIGLAVWRANRKAHPQFDDWMFAPPAPPPLAEVTEYAEKLTGVRVLRTALKDPWIEAQLQRDISVYETNYLHGVGNMPQLIIGTKIYGSFEKAEDLIRVLHESFEEKGGAK
jgi:hypothetical protein